MRFGKKETNWINCYKQYFTYSKKRIK
jgi:hypothetical protein